MTVDAITTDAFLGGRLHLRQPGSGHRAGTDAILLAAAVPASATGFALDIGAGVGAAGLALAKLHPRLMSGLVENDAAIAALARGNAALNGLEDRARVYEADALSAESLRAAGLAQGCAQLVITNPPFLDPARARLSPTKGKRTAHAMSTPGSQPLADWIAACLALLEDGGTFAMIHRPEALPDIVAVLERKAGALALMPVLPRADKAATRILLSATKGNRAPLKIAPPLILHGDEKFTPEAEAIHRGEAFIKW
jgi:tRNA1(Val) A37 N6-methylase TrmN6